MSTGSSAQKRILGEIKAYFSASARRMRAVRPMLFEVGFPARQPLGGGRRSPTDWPRVVAEPGGSVQLAREAALARHCLRALRLGLPLNMDENGHCCQELNASMEFKGV